MDDEIVIFGKAGEKLRIFRRVDGRGHRQLAAGVHVGVDLGRGGVHAVQIIAPAHGHVQGDEADTVFRELLRAEVAGTVRGDLPTHTLLRSGNWALSFK